MSSARSAVCVRSIARLSTSLRIELIPVSDLFNIRNIQVALNTVRVISAPFGEAMESVQRDVSQPRFDRDSAVAVRVRRESRLL